MRVSRAALWSAALAVAGVTALLGGCATGDLRAGGSYVRSLDDSSAALAIKSRLLRSASDFSGVDVNLVDGLALLTGYVETEAAREEAVRIAWSAPNVTEVGDELAIGEAAQRRFLGAGDQAISAQVRARLTADPVATGSTINIETFDATVYLLGRAADAESAARAAELAARVGGVKRVISYLRTPGEATSGPVVGGGARASSPSDTVSEDPASGLLGGPQD